MTKISLGTQLFTFRNVIKSEDDLRFVLESVKGYGCDVAQLSGVKIDASPKRIREIADDCGITIPVTHTPFNRITEQTDLVAEEHLVLGAHSVGLGMMPAEYALSRDGLSRFIEIANRVSDNLKPYGLKFAYHNHAHEFKKIDGKRIIDILFDEVTDLEFIFDTFWCAYAHCDPTEYLGRLSGRITDIHLKDRAPSLFIPKIRDVGKGNLDFSAILAAAEKGGTQYAYIEHDFTRDPYKTTKESMAFLRSIY